MAQIRILRPDTVVLLQTVVVCLGVASALVLSVSAFQVTPEELRALTTTKMDYNGAALASLAEQVGQARTGVFYLVLTVVAELLTLRKREMVKARGRVLAIAIGIGLSGLVFLAGQKWSEIVIKDLVARATDLPASGQSLDGAAIPSDRATSTSWLQLWKDGAEAAQASATVVAIMLGGFWTYRLFVKNREAYPRVTVQHSVTRWHPYLRVTIRMSNLGKVMLDVGSLSVTIQQLFPVSGEIGRNTQPKDRLPDGTEFQWPTLDERTFDFAQESLEVEPGESEECHVDFILPSDAQMISVYSYIKNKTKTAREIGWNTTTVHRILAGGVDDNTERAAEAAENQPGIAQKDTTPTAAAADGEEGRIGGQYGKVVGGQDGDQIDHEAGTA